MVMCGIPRLRKTGSLIQRSTAAYTMDCHGTGWDGPAAEQAAHKSTCAHHTTSVLSHFRNVASTPYGATSLVSPLNRRLKKESAEVELARDVMS